MNSYVVVGNVGRGFVNQDPSPPSGTAQTFVCAPQMKLRNEAPFPSIWDEVVPCLYTGKLLTSFTSSKYTDHLACWTSLTTTQLCMLLYCWRNTCWKRKLHHPSVSPTPTNSSSLVFLIEQFPQLHGKKTHSLNYMRANTQKLTFAGPMRIKR